MVGGRQGGEKAAGRQMERLSGLDAAFLAMETGSSHLHVAAVLVFEPPGFRLAELRRVVAERLHLVPPFRRRVVRVPFGIHHPVWVEDPLFDLTYHLRRASLPSPGGPGELAEYVAQVVGQPLDPSRPLWEMHLVEGLEGGHVAVVAKIHHAAIDGVSGAETLATFLDLVPEGRLVEPPAEPWRPEVVPGERELLTSGLQSLVREPEKVVGALARTISSVRELTQQNRRLREEDEVEPPPYPFRAPRTSLNGAISPHRRFALATGSLQDVRTVKEVFGGTVNDVVLTVVAGALRRTLEDRGEDVEEALVAMVPVSTRVGEPEEGPRNRVSAMLVSLASQLADPVERLAAVTEASRLAKAQIGLIPESLFQGWAQLAFPALSARAARLAGNLRVFDHLNPLANVIVSNIPGPDFPLYCAGSRLAGLYPVGPISEGVGLNVTVMSYQGTLFFGLLACRDLVPEVEDLAHHLTDELAELVKLAARAGDRAN